MAKPLRLDPAGMPEEPTLVLGNKAGDKLGKLVGTGNYVYHCSFASADELSFDLYKTIDGMVNPLWDKITDFKLVWFQDIDMWFQIKIELDEADATVKHIIGTPVAEAELSQTNVYDIEINTESDILQDDYVITTFYNSTNPKGSLLDRLLYKSPGYTIGHVDSSLQDIQRTFSWSESTVYDAYQDVAEEIGCLFVFGSGTDRETGRIQRTINAYDLMSYCRNCGKRFEGGGDTCPYCGASGEELIAEPYGIESGIIVSRDNLTQEIKLTTDIDSVKNCFHLEAGDDMMTSAVRYATPDGSGYLWYISDELKAEMSDELAAKIDEYDALYQQYLTDWPFTIDSADYNALIDKYAAYSTDYNRIYSGGETPTGDSDIVLDNYTDLVEADYSALDFYYYLHDSMMPGYTKPDMSTEQQARAAVAGLGSGVSLLRITTSTSNSTVESAIKSMARLYIDSDYDISASTSSWTPSNGSGTWSGTITITNRKDSADTYTSGTFSIGFSGTADDYLHQVLAKKIYQYQSATYDIESLFELAQSYTISDGKVTIDATSPFSAALKLYSYAVLEEFYQCCQTCINVLIDNGCGTPGKTIYLGVNWDGYTNMYLPWYAKLLAIQSEMDIRASEVATAQAMIDDLEALIQGVHEALDFETYLGPDLWAEFVTYRREDTYRNTNFISDGLSNAEIVENARRFVDLANREIYKSAQLQHSIEATLHDLLVIPEFQPIIDNFEIGAWIRIIVDEKPYKLRLIDYEVDWADLTSIEVQFSDVLKVSTGISDVQSILDSAQRMATSYGAVLRKADQGDSANITMRQWIDDGLNATNVKLVSSASNQEWEMSERGFLMQRWDEMLEEYTKEQMLFTNTTIAFTDDGGQTIKTAFGKYYDGDGNAQTGLIGDTIIGKILAGANLVIDSENGSFRVNSNGVYIDSLQFYITHGGDTYDTTLEDELDSFVDQNDLATAIQDAIADIGGTITTYYQGADEGVPEANTGDLWYVSGDTDVIAGDITYSAGQLYRYSGTDWEHLEDATATQAIVDAATAQSTADSKILFFKQGSIPSAPDDGDIWFNTSASLSGYDRNKMYRYNGTTSAWELIEDASISANYNALLTEINSKTEIYSGNTAPSNPSSGDFWYCTQDGDSYMANNLYRYGGSSWVQVQDSAAQSLAQEAQDTADGKITCFYQETAPSVDDINQEGDLWYDSSNKKWYRCTQKETSSSVSSTSDLEWASVEDGSIATNYTEFSNAIQNLTTAVNSTTKVFYDSTVPTDMTTGDLWYCTDDTGTYVEGYLYRYNGSSWDHLEDSQATQAIAAAGTAQATADGKIMFYRQSTAPTIDTHSTGDIWYNTASTDSANYLAGKLYRCDGSSWVLVEDSSIAELETATANINTTIASFFDTSTGYLNATKLNGVISATRSQMASSNGNVLFDSDGIWLMDNASKSAATKAVWMNEDGILLGSGSASSDPASNFVWQTAITSDGIAAETIAAGTISGVTLAGGSLKIGTNSGATDGYNCYIDSAGNLGIGPNSSATKKYNFYVDSSGNVTANSMSITGGSITIGNNFSVDSSGNVRASNGTFSGIIKVSDLQTTSGTSMLSSGKIKADYLSLAGLSITNASGNTVMSFGANGVTLYGGAITWGSDISTDNITGLATVATTGSYNSLSNKPTIPEVPSYIKSTYIDSTSISSPTITGGTITGAELVSQGNGTLSGSQEIIMDGAKIVFNQYVANSSGGTTAQLMGQMYMQSTSASDTLIISTSTNATGITLSTPGTIKFNANRGIIIDSDAYGSSLPTSSLTTGRLFFKTS